MRIRLVIVVFIAFGTFMEREDLPEFAIAPGRCGFSEPRSDFKLVNSCVYRVHRFPS